MVLPDYFIADLSADAPIQPALITEAAQTLKRNRERYLLTRSTESIIQTLAELARAWAHPHSPWRSLALDQGPAVTGFSRAVLAAGLDAALRNLAPRPLHALLLQEFGHPQRIDRLTSNDAENIAGLAAMVTGPELLVHACESPVPTEALMALTRGLLVRSAQFLVSPPGLSLFPRLFAHCLRDLEPKLAACIELGAWEPSRGDLDQALLSETACLAGEYTASTRQRWASAAPAKTRSLLRSPRLSAAYVTRDMLAPHQVAAVLAAAAADIATWDQVGSLAPHVVYVETGGMLPPEKFAAELAEALAQAERDLPAGDRTPAANTLLDQRREFYAIRAAGGDTTQCWYSPGSRAWSVVYDPDPVFQQSCGHRFILVKPVDTPDDFLRHAERVREEWSTLGLAAPGIRAAELADLFTRWGIRRVCALGRMQSPPLNARLDGRPVLGDLVTWSQHELGYET